ncbi:MULTISPECIES: stalk domain-containing protein [unclassified Paenibacillus]|uniref:stalk domain-containing protein n=1 Tax=unclassified Paenibacillus TaxID=185978 RepID=UPI001C10EC03|nr:MULTISPECIES: stalk domain-containing protein [unclassified Paenibacillus]MBU5440574.1 copper amine oxidase N-terminal domain-containing protein [Paenibacillus sp. MSJ-34]CAH0120040.1 hypothetical protein PAE9249_02553 [Paenibacillus sp. CECT 9249]
MKARRVILLALAFSLMGGSLMFADSVSQKVRLLVNGQESSEGGILVNGKAYIPVKQISDSLQAMVDWDENAKKVTVYKPNVHMLTFSGKDIFGIVKKGEKKKFNVLVSGDNMVADVDSFRVSITDPAGKSTTIQELNVKEKTEYFTFQTEELVYDFAATGKYTVGFYIKQSKTSDYVLVSEKVINVIS